MSGCGATCGINRERERERQTALGAVERAYPGLVWHDRPALAMGLAPDAVVALGRELEELLPVRAVYRPGEPSSGGKGGCDWLYLLAGFASPCLLERADGFAFEASCDERDSPSEETYVRLGFSPLGPYVTLQEVVVRSIAPRPGAPAMICVEPQIGVADRRLQAIVKGLQGKLRKERLVVLDMAFLMKSVEEAATLEASPQRPAQTDFLRAFGAEPSLFAFLFEPAPPDATRAVFEHGFDAAAPSE